MIQTYTIEKVIPTGKSSPMYGVEYSVKFADADGVFKLWFKNEPTPGQEQRGEIDDWKFKKEKKEWNGDVVNTPDAPQQIKPAYSKPAYKDNSDGMRQGMCFNNAANYVNSAAAESLLTATEWADEVFGYARALYLKGDLNSIEESVSDVFKDENANG